VRKDVLRNDTGEPLARLCTWDTTIGQDWLFVCDVTKKCKERAEDHYKPGQKRKHSSKQTSSKRCIIYNCASYVYRFDAQVTSVFDTR